MISMMRSIAQPSHPNYSTLPTSNLGRLGRKASKESYSQGVEPAVNCPDSQACAYPPTSSLIPLRTDPSAPCPNWSAACI